jgi:hypothetical protein
VLTVKGERRFARQEGDEIVATERPQGVFTRQLFLGDTLDGERISAYYRDGVLTLTIPIAERAKPRKVEISTQGRRSSPPVMAASAARTTARSRPTWPVARPPDHPSRTHGQPTATPRAASRLRRDRSHRGVPADHLEGSALRPAWQEARS